MLNKRIGRSKLFKRTILLKKILAILLNDIRFSPEIRERVLKDSISYLNSLKDGHLFLKGENVEYDKMDSANFLDLTSMCEFQCTRSDEEFLIGLFKISHGDSKAFENDSSKEFYKDDFPNKIDNYTNILNKISCSYNCVVVQHTLICYIQISCVWKCHSKSCCE